MKENRGAIVDTLCILNAHSLATITSAVAGKNAAGSVTYFDTGGGFTEAKVVFDVGLVPVTASSAVKIQIQGSTTTSFATFVKLNELNLGAAARTGHSIATTTGRYIQSINNRFNDSLYRYIRAYIGANGTMGTGIKVGIVLASK